LLSQYSYDLFWTYMLSLFYLALFGGWQQVDLTLALSNSLR